MKKYNFICNILCVFVFSCTPDVGDSDSNPPEKLIPKEKFVSILADIHTAEAMVSNGGGEVNMPILKYQKYEHSIFLAHKVDTAVYFQSYEYYLSSINHSEKIYAMLLDTLKMRREKIK